MFSPADVERFWSRVNKSDPDGHWFWVGACDRFYFRVSGRSSALYARDVALMLNGMDTDTAMGCRTPRCINPFCAPERYLPSRARRLRARLSA